jgi:hypothetical protein
MSGLPRLGLGFDLGKRCGWALVYLRSQDELPTLVADGTIDTYEQASGDDYGIMGQWFAALKLLATGKHPAVREQRYQHRVEAFGYEQIRHMQGQGARYILMQEGALLAACHQSGSLCQGVNTATLKAFADARDIKGDPAKGIPKVRAVETMRSNMTDTFDGDLSNVTLDSTVAAWAAYWVLLHAQEA